ncbi:MAG: pilin, partial [Candidatus Pacebacteria bacterium]|nr:pilin [Candidatus Paceibacterota bacterium]
GAGGGITPAPAAAPDIEPAQLPRWDAREVLNLVTRITNWIFTFLIAVVVIMVLVAGYMFVTAGGNPEKQGKASKILIYALIGFAVGMLARGVIALVAAVIGRAVPEFPEFPGRGTS